MTRKTISARPMAEIARDYAQLKTRHADLIATCSSGKATDQDIEALRQADADIHAFDDGCMRTKRHHLMSVELGWGDNIHHPAAPELVALVRTGDRVVLNDREMTLQEATRMVAEHANKGCAMADWIRPDGSMIGESLGMVHPHRHNMTAPRASSATEDSEPKFLTEEAPKKIVQEDSTIARADKKTPDDRQHSLF